MNNAQYRGLQFIFPESDRPDEHSGLSTSPTGALQMVEDDATVRQAILMLLNTAPGERIMRPDYGCELSKLLFAPNDDTTAGLAIHYVRRALERWEPRIDILSVDATRNKDNPDYLEIILEYRIRSTQNNEQLSFLFNLAA
ncbi:MAG: hypothetical protein DRR08_07215 [Candidatus Parabeggiatoa sp. nov. 2]|nr:MAG: hypothetical protein B6247_09260 [Beggiatoa sp. 4572_84]RKZ62015.1 MAG: hypothetical protein DRR08_07215 [Gammaproteobacteria bacterium]